MLGDVCDDLGRDHGGGMVNKFPACRQVPAPSLRDIPSRRRTRMPAVPAGHEKTAARSARKSRKYDHPAIALSTFQPFNCSTFQPCVPCSCRPKADFVSREAGFRVHRKRRRCSHRKGMGWRRPCSHGSAQSLSRRTAMAVRRDGGFRGRALAPLAMTVSGTSNHTYARSPSFFGWDGSILHTPPHFTNRIRANGGVQDKFVKGG